jgi:hypothetical protein
MPQNSKTLNDVTESELIAALQAALKKQAEDTEADAFTRVQYEEMMGVSRYRARLDLRALVRNGTLENAYVTIVNAWGERQRVKGYRLARKDDGEN